MVLVAKSGLLAGLLKWDMVFSLELNWMKRSLKEEMELFKACTTSFVTIRKPFSSDQTKYKLVSSQKLKKVTKYDKYRNNFLIFKSDDQSIVERFSMFAVCAAQACEFLPVVCLDWGWSQMLFGF